jgi:hypothetical protein
MFITILKNLKKSLVLIILVKIIKQKKEKNFLKGLKPFARDVQ